jgi:hypothetical protein
MPTRRGYLAPHKFSEIYGRVIGLYSDPTDAVIQRFTYIFNGANALISYGTNASLAQNLVWSRLLLCEIILPNDTTCAYSKLALVLKPQAMWLFDATTPPNSTIVSDYMGNCVDFGEDNSAICNSESPISPVNPPYGYGDVIRIATLPYPLTLATWSDGFSVSDSNCDPLSASYPKFAASVGDGDCKYHIRNAQTSCLINGLYILGAKYRPGFYTNGPAETKVVYYDRNVDARTRFGGTGGGADSLCPY